MCGGSAARMLSFQGDSRWCILCAHRSVSVRGNGPSNSTHSPSQDGFFIGLWLDQQHGNDLVDGGFNGAYTYFATDGFSWGSTTHNWATMSRFCEERGILFGECCCLSSPPLRFVLDHHLCQRA